MDLTPTGNAWVPVQSFVLRRCASTSSSRFPANSGLQWDQFYYGIGPGLTAGTAGWVGGVGGCMGGARGPTGSAAGGGCGAGGLSSATIIHVLFWKRLLSLLFTLSNLKINGKWNSYI